jgi:regulator of protease activity HflC (stomatin/prohibitin superfamily)
LDWALPQKKFKLCLKRNCLNGNQMDRRQAVQNNPDRRIKMTTNTLLLSRKMKAAARNNANMRINGVAGTLATILFLICIIGTTIMAENNVNDLLIITFLIVTGLLALYVLFGLKIADQWEKAVVLRLGKFQGLKGPGLFWVIPIIDTITEWIDHRVMVSPFSAEKTLTKDTVPVDVDAVLFWLVWDAEKAALEVEDYRMAITWAAQTALREVIGALDLADILIGRAKMDKDLQKIIDERTTPWGISVQSVEIRDVVIPQDLEDTMSRQAQAERERQARVILGQSEMQIANSFAEASKAYINNPTALHLRAMNMLFEGLKEKGALVIVPSSAVETMNLGGLSGTIALAQQTESRSGK